METVASTGKTAPPSPSGPSGGPATGAAPPLPAARVAPQAPVAQTPLPDPLLTALSQLLGLFGTHKSEDALAAGIPHERPLQPASFSRIAEANGCKVRIQPRRLEQISDLLLPVILLLDRQQACLFLARRPNDRIVILPCEPGAVEIELGAAGLAARYIGTCIFIRPAIRVEDRSIVAARSTEKDWFWGTIWRYKGYYGQAAAAALLVNVLALAGTFFTMNVYDRVISNQAYVTLWTLAAGVTVAMVFEYLSRNLRSWLLDNAGKKADLLLGSALFRQAMMSRLEHRPPSAGAYASTLREFESVRDFATSATLATITDLPFILLFVWIIHLIAGPLFWVPLACVPVLMIVGGLAQFPLSRYVNEHLREGSVKHGILVEALESAETIKALRVESQMQAKYERAAALTARTAMKSRTITAMVSNFTNFLQSVCTVVMVVWGVYLIGGGQLTMGALIGAVLLASRAIAPAASITALAVRYQQARMALKSLNRVMATPTDREAQRSYLHKPTAAGAVTATGISFRYGPQSGDSIANLSLNVQPGERIAVLGRIGSGKSTMLKVLSGLYRPTQGNVKLDGVDLQQIEPADVRRHVLYVGQDVRLLFGSLRENLKAGNPHIDDESMIRVADAFGVHAFASAHPFGYDMPIGEGGVGLSGGQRQAVGLARAVLANPSVMLLDEPTSAMDNATEAMAMGALARLCAGKTMIYVTHKLQLLDYVTRVVILDAGTRVADGPKEAVLQALKEGKIQEPGVAETSVGPLAVKPPAGALAVPQDRSAFAEPAYRGSGTDFDFMRDMQQAMVNDRQRSSALLLALILGLFCAAAVWAYYSRLEEITRGDARIIASSREQVIQSLEGGILAEMLVREGDIVNAGQSLLRIDETKARSSYQEGYSKSISLKAAAARLRAESRGTKLQFPADVLADAEIVKNETDNYNARKFALDQSVTTAASSRGLIAREIAITEPMVAKGLVAETELLRLRRQFNELQMQTQERVNKYRVDAANELGKVESELAQIQEVLTAREDQVKRTVVAAPVRGTVKNIRMNTRGGVIQPGQDIMEIVPLEDQLLVEAKIRPHDVAFLRPGLPATVKVTAYDYAIYGGLDGHVERISPDTLREEKRPEEDSYYRVVVRTRSSTLSAGGKELPIIPGMTASVEIRTGEKTVMDYVLKPVLKVREALRER